MWRSTIEEIRYMTRTNIHANYIPRTNVIGEGGYYGRVILKSEVIYICLRLVLHASIMTENKSVLYNSFTY